MLPSLSISDVLFVPLLNCNLLSISQLTKSYHCVVLFFPTRYIFQNIHIKEKIGRGKKIGVLYYLEDGFKRSNGKVLAHAMKKTC